MKVVIDTNCFIVSIARKSKYRPVFDAFLQEKYSLIINNDILLEYEEIITEKANSIVAGNIINQLLKSRNIIYQQVYYKWNLITADPDDNKFSDIAIASNADYLVTDDKHFNELYNMTFPVVNIISIKEFLKLVESL